MTSTHQSSVVYTIPSALSSRRVSFMHLLYPPSALRGSFPSASWRIGKLRRDLDLCPCLLISVSSSPRAQGSLGWSPAVMFSAMMVLVTTTPMPLNAT